MIKTKKAPLPLQFGPILPKRARSLKSSRSYHAMLASYPLVHSWSVLGSGAYAKVFNVGVRLSATRILQVAVKVIGYDDPDAMDVGEYSEREDVSLQEVEDEAFMNRLLGGLGVPSFTPLLGSFFYKESGEAATPYLALLTEVASEGRLSAVVKSLNAEAATQILFQLLWSHTKAVKKIDAELRDISSNNIVIHASESAPVTRGQRFLLYNAQNQPMAQWHLDLNSAKKTNYIGRFIDFGFSTAAVTKGRPLHDRYRGMAMHMTPEAYFEAVEEQNGRGDLYQLGLVAFTLFGTRHCPAEIQDRLPVYVDLIDAFAWLQPHWSLAQSFFSEILLNDIILNDIFKDDAVGGQGHYQQRLKDSLVNNGHVFERFAAVACLQQAVGNDWRPFLHFFPNSALLRVLYHPLAEFWWIAHMERSHLSACFKTVLSSMTGDERSLIKHLLAWHPAQRLQGPALLTHNVFDSLLLRHDTQQPVGSQVKIDFYQFHWQESNLQERDKLVERIENECRAQRDAIPLATNAIELKQNIVHCLLPM